MKEWIRKSLALLEKHERKLHYNNATHECTKCDKEFTSLEALKIHCLHKHRKKKASPEREIRDSESSTERESTFRPKTTDCTDFDEDNLSSTVTENENANTTDDLNNDKSIPSNVQSSGTVASQPDTAPRSRQNISILYECNICEKRFKTQHALNRHKTVQHTDKASLTCTKCNKQFNSFEPLKEHFLFKHTNWKKENREASPEREIRDAESSTEKESTFRPKARDCTDFDEDNLSSPVTENENANTAGDLNNDKSIPSNVQSSGTVASQPDTAPRSRQNISILYECNICEKRFKTQHALERHKTVQHTDKASLTCTKCNEQFNSFEPLKEHFLFTHTNWKKENREESSDDDIQIEDVTSENENINLESGDIPIQTHVSNTTDSLRDKSMNIAIVGCKASGLPKVKVLSNTTLSFGDQESGASLRDGLNTPETNDLRLKVKAKLDETVENFTKRFEEDSVKDFAPNAKKITNQDNESNGNLQNRHIVVSLSNANEKASDSKKITYYIVDTHSKESISNVKSNLLREAVTASAVPLVTNTVLKTDSPSNYASGTQSTANMFEYMLSNIQRSTTNVDKTLAISIANFKRLSRPVSNAANLKPSVTNTSNPANTPSVKGKAVHVCSGSTSPGLSRDHFKTHTLVELYTCKACGKRFVGSLAFIRHCLTHNADTINYREKTKNNPPNPVNEVTDKVYSEAGITGHDGEMFDPLGGNVEMLDNCTQFDDYAISSGDENSISESSDEEPLDGEASKDLVAVALDEPCVELEEEYYGNNKPVDPFSEIKEYEHVPGPLVIKSENIEENNISDELSIHDCLKDIPAKRKHQNLKEQFENIDNLEYLSAKRIKGVEKNLDNIKFVGQFSEENTVSIPLSTKVSEERNRTNSVPVPKILVDSLIIPTHEHNQNIDKGILEYLHEKRINGDEYNLNHIGSTVEDIDILLENKESIITENTTYNMPHPDVRTLNELVMDTVCTLKKEENVAEAALDTDIRDDKTSLALECLSSNRIPRVYLERLPITIPLKTVKIVN